jgi:Glycosyl hydrolase catalytic core
MKRFVLVASVLAFAFVAPASADVAAPSQYGWHDSCPWLCQGHERPAPGAQATEEAGFGEGAPGEASDGAPPEGPSQEEAPASGEETPGLAAEEEEEGAAQEEEAAAQLLAAGADPAQTPVEASKRERRQKRKRERAEREAKQEAPSPGSLWVGVNGGGWGPSEPPEMAPMVKYVRLESGNPTEFDAFQASGIKVDWDDAGPYSKRGVSSINAAEYAERLVRVVEADPSIVSVEILNEPDGSWFWGEGASSKANAEAYARLLEAVYNKLTAKFGAQHPVLLGAFEEGSTWGDAWWNALKQKEAVGGVVVHPYGGTGSRAQSASGDRGQVERAHSYTGKPVYVTEVGWPTATSFPPTGDSLQWPQPEQAQNIYSFVNWARSTGYVGGVFIYEYHDAELNGPAEYGVVTHSGVKKAGWTALKDAAEGVACTVCS